MKNDLYRSRLADQMLSEHLKAFGAVCVEGPKWCGKTWLAQHQAVSACMIADPTDNFATRGRIELDINYAFVNRKTPRSLIRQQMGLTASGRDGLRRGRIERTGRSPSLPDAVNAFSCRIYR